MVAALRRSDVNRLALRHLVCSIDVSGSFTAPLAYAMAIARAHESDLRVVHVIPTAEPAVPDDVGSLRRTQALDRLRAIVEDAGTSTPDLVGTAVRTGDPATQILRVARGLSADLIVLGAPKVETPERPAGPVASVVVSRSECPVLTVPTGPAAPVDATGVFTRIVCAADPSPSCASVIRQALSLAWESNGELTIASVAPSDDASPAQIRDALMAAIPADAADWCNVEVVVVSGVPGPEIVRLATERNAEVIVIGAPRRWTSATHGVLGHARCPVLVTHDTRPLPWPTATRDVTTAAGMNRSRS
jgi:nucleotide-binding universal stress UspA family protein